jgi:serine/threonine protein kinase
MMTGQAGTFHWMAPETLENKPYTHKADVYSYGVIILFIFDKFDFRLYYGK